MNNSQNLKETSQNLKKKQKQWQHERLQYERTIHLMQQQIMKYKLQNTQLLKKTKQKHVRTTSEQQTFIFNQTNISSYYPIVILKNNNWLHKGNLRSHLDSVRCLKWKGSFLISAGEDSMLKIWEKDQLKVNVRQHLGPVYSICVNGDNIFTGGVEGVVRHWSLSSLLSNETSSIESQLHEQPIWSLTSPQQNILITSSSDQTHKIVKITQDQLQEIDSIFINNDIPTSIETMDNSKFISGFVQNQILKVYDIEKSKYCGQYQFEGKQSSSQVNQVVYDPKSKMVATAHEDNCLRFFDANSNKQIKQMIAHSDAVTSILFKPENYELISGSHDGNLRIWDLRKYKCVNDISVNMKKYDESVHCLAMNKEHNTMAVGGADGNIKLLQQQH